MTRAEVERYELQFTRGGQWHSVTKQEWVAAERACGFVNKCGNTDEPATGGFGSGSMSGRISRTGTAPLAGDGGGV